MTESIQVRICRTIDQLEIGRTYTCGEKVEAIEVEFRGWDRWIVYDRSVDIARQVSKCAAILDKDQVIFWNGDFDLHTNGEKAIILKVGSRYVLLVNGIGPFFELN